MRKTMWGMVACLCLLAVSMIGCGADSQNVQETQMPTQEEAADEAQTFTQLFEFYMDADGEEYDPRQFELGKTMLSDLVRARGEGLAYTGTVENWEEDHLAYEETDPRDEERVVHAYYYGDGSKGTESPVIIQAIYLIPFESEEECKMGCEAFLNWIQAIDPRTSHWKLEDLFFKSSSGTFLNKEVGISGKELLTEMHFGVVWTADERSHIPDQNNCFSIMLRVGSNWEEKRVG